MNTGIIDQFNPLMALLSSRNQLADAIFYDVTSLSPSEWIALKPWVDQKGGIVVVPPTNSREPIRHYKHPLEFILNERDKVEAIAVAGVGSSVVGTAALARNVADVYDFSVAGIVSGFGLSDIVLEGLGGWYFYGQVDQLRYEMERGFADLRAIVTKSFGGKGDRFLDRFDFPLDDYVPPMLDIGGLNEILMVRYLNAAQPKLKIRLLVGHSKGNLLISSALNHICGELRDMMGDTTFLKADLAMKNLAVVSLGAVVDLPSKLVPLENQHQFIGTLDVLGRLNSRSLGGNLSDAAIRIDGAMHHLNTRIPAYFDAKAVLNEYLPKSKVPKIDPDIQPHEAKRDRLYRNASQPAE
jgi:hypothetical protein